MPVLHHYLPCPRSYLAYATLISTFYYYYTYLETSLTLLIFREAMYMTTNRSFIEFERQRNCIESIDVDWLCRKASHLCTWRPNTGTCGLRDSF